MTTAHQRLAQLLDYVVEQSRNLDPKVFNLTGLSRTPDLVYAGSVLAGLPGVELNLEDRGDPVWIRVHRLGKTTPSLHDPDRLLVGGDDPYEMPPSVDDTAWETYAAGVFAANGTLAPHQTPEALAWRDAWLADQHAAWALWAEDEKARRKSMKFYRHLFEVRQALDHEDSGKPRELVVGMGVAAQRLAFPGSASTLPAQEVGADGQPGGNGAAPARAGAAEKPGTGSERSNLQYPLVTQAVQVTLNPTTGSLDVRPRLVNARLEMEAFALAKVPGVAMVEAKVRNDLAALGEGVGPFDMTELAPLLRNVAESLDAAGRYASGMLEWPAAGQHLVVSDAWVLMERPKSANYLHEDIARLQDGLRQGVTLPSGGRALVTPPDDAVLVPEPMRFRGRSGVIGDPRHTGTPRELYFPLPYNREQVSIVERLEQADGMTVQGPPGTGKTHTIANIVCHYLAQGRKVLVTSKGEKALTVLQDKIPKEVRPLTVALLADDKVGARQFQASIDTIMLNVAQMNPAMMEEDIRRLRESIDQVHSQLAMVDHRLQSIAHEQLGEVTVDGQAWRAQAMADMVVNGRALHAWFDDALTLDAQHAPPFSDSDAARLRQARRLLGEDLLTLNDRVPASSTLPSTTLVQGWHGALLDAAQAAHDEQQGELWPLREASPERDDALARLATLLELSVERWSSLQQAVAEGDTWIPQLRRQCRDTSYTSELQALNVLFKDMAKLAEQRASSLKTAVDIPAGAMASKAFADAVAKAQQTGKPFGFMGWGSDATTKAWVAKVLVAGTPPASANDWKHVADTLALHANLRSFTARWNRLAEDLGLPTLSEGWKALRRVETLGKRVHETHRLAVEVDVPAMALLDKVFVTPDRSVLTGDVGATKALHAQLVRRLREPAQRHAALAVAGLQHDLSDTHGVLSERLIAWSRDLGNPARDSLDLVNAYTGIVEQVRRREGLEDAFVTVKMATRSIEDAGAGRWAHRLRTVVVPAAGDDPVFPNDWQAAWTFARFRTHLERIEARHEMVQLSTERGALEHTLAGLYEKLVARTAWLSTKLNATAKVLSALETYQTAVRHIGKGTGVNAPRHRRDAQKAMREAQGAIPCWIMSHAKVSESLPSDMGNFDLVIVDEASQSDLGSLPAVLRGKKILVVGDDKQVSPSATTVAAEHVQSLRERFLVDQPYAAMLTPEKSLYEITKAVFAGHSVMLREHFRCVPAIVEYSNRTFYDGGIQPLRIPNASERLDPPLVDWHVPVGVRNKEINVSEAECITAEIAAILSSPDVRFQGKSIGVVSLQGMEQARLIDQMVRERCDGAELARRNFDCGTARLFQGGERDIMFLSMVVSPNQVHAATKKSDEQVFNVAATRARDRMYLVRSVGLEHLSPTAEDLRKGLLQHFQAPLHGSHEATDRSLIERCESGFEREVYTALVQRGYRVTPQVPAGGFRLDMVVEGDRDARLAIECDGDAFHGPERWEQDMARQRVLERAGWVFWRCFASTWSLHREAVIEELVARLKALGIEPLGALDRLPSLTESRSWTQMPHTAGVGPTKARKGRQPVATTDLGPVVTSTVVDEPGTPLRPEAMGAALPASTVVEPGRPLFD